MEKQQYIPKKFKKSTNKHNHAKFDYDMIDILRLKCKNRRPCCGPPV